MPGVLVRLLHGVQGIPALDHRIATLAEELAGRVPDGVFIFHQQQRLPPAERFRFDVGLAWPTDLRALFHPWEVHLKGGSHSRLAVDPDKTAALFHNPVYRGQPQSRALALFLGGVERLEDVGQMLGFDAVTAITDLE